MFKGLVEAIRWTYSETGFFRKKVVCGIVCGSCGWKSYGVQGTPAHVSGMGNPLMTADTRLLQANNATPEVEVTCSLLRVWASLDIPWEKNIIRNVHIRPAGRSF